MVPGPGPQTLLLRPARCAEGQSRVKRGGTSCSAHGLALTPARRNSRTACSDCVRHDINCSRCCLLSIVLFLSSSNRLFSRRSRALGMLHEHHWLRRCRSPYARIRCTYRYACMSLLKCYCIAPCFACLRAQSTLLPFSTPQIHMPGQFTKHPGRRS